MALSTQQKNDIISRYRQVITNILAEFAIVKGIGDQIAVLGLLDPSSDNLLTADDFVGENAAIDLARFGAAAIAMGQLDALFSAEIRKAFYEVKL